VFALSLHHLPPALAARVFAEVTPAANKLLIIDLHVWRRSWGAMASTLARFTARRTTRDRTSARAGNWSSALQVCDLLLRRHYRVCIDCPHETMLTPESLNLFGQQLKLSLEIQDGVV
jgi:hypothetical protein